MLFVPVCKFAKLNPEADNILSILFLVKIFWIVNKRLQIRVWYTHRKNTLYKMYSRRWFGNELYEIPTNNIHANAIDKSPWIFSLKVRNFNYIT